MTPPRDHDDEDEVDWDDPEADEGDDSDDSLTISCPSCQREMFEDSPRCPSCGYFISEEDHPGRRQPRWVVVTALICLGIAIWWAMSARGR